LVSVLLGLLEPVEGRVLVEGSALSDLDVESWRQAASGAFQDSWRAELTVDAGVGVGELEGPHRDVLPGEPVVMAAVDRADAGDLVSSLPDGVRTQLGTDWPDGVGLSGGQWQRLALARGMVRGAPLLLVLDEPTSALDPATEHRILETYLEASRRTREIGGVTVVVTHRLSTAASADLVVVLDHGRVREQGTHRELLDAGGLYAELFSMQASGYR
jgi:ATP-binding cassette subfamily B protein